MDLAELQDKEVGDGTTSVVILAAELLKVMIIWDFFSSSVGFFRSYCLKDGYLFNFWFDFNLQRANDLVKHKIHPTSIISGYRVSIFLIVCVLIFADNCI